METLTPQASQASSQTSPSSSNTPPQPKYRLLYITLAWLNANLGFLFFNYILAIFNAVLDFLKDYIFPDAASGATTFVASAPIITSAISAAFAGYFITKFGRRKVMIVSDVIGIVGVILCLIDNLAVMIVGRLILGLNIGTTTVVVPLYYTELSPIVYRGAFAAGPPLLGAVGVLAAFCLGLLVPQTLAPGETDNIWRVLQAVSIGILGLRSLNLLIFFRYDTPTYYIERNKLMEARLSLSKIQKTGIEERMQELIKERDYVSAAGKVPFFQLFTKKYRKALFVCTVMMSLNILCGFSIVLVYSKKIFGYGLDETDRLAQYLSIALAGVMLLTGIVSIWVINRFKRKTLLILGALVMGIIELLFAIVGQTTPPGNLASKIILIFWPIPFVLSLGSVVLEMSAETLPEIGYSFAFFINWVWSFLTLQFFPDISDAIGIPQTFYITGGICIACAIFFWFFAVETKNLDKATILQKYSGVKLEDSRPRAEGRQVESLNTENNRGEVAVNVIKGLDGDKVEQDTVQNRQNIPIEIR